MQSFKQWHNTMQMLFPSGFALPPTNGARVLISRNKREGKYYGWVKGRHLRWGYPHKVSSWLAFRLHSERKQK